MSIVLLFKNSPTGMQFLLRFHRFRRLLNSATAALSSPIDAHTLAGPQRGFAFPQDVVSQASKASPEMSNYPCHDVVHVRLTLYGPVRTQATGDL